MVAFLVQFFRRGGDQAVLVLLLCCCEPGIVLESIVNREEFVRVNHTVFPQNYDTSTPNGRVSPDRALAPGSTVEGILWKLRALACLQEKKPRDPLR